MCWLCADANFYHNLKYYIYIYIEFFSHLFFYIATVILLFLFFGAEYNKLIIMINKIFIIISSLIIRIFFFSFFLIFYWWIVLSEENLFMRSNSIFRFWKDLFENFFRNIYKNRNECNIFYLYLNGVSLKFSYSSALFLNVLKCIFYIYTARFKKLIRLNLSTTKRCRSTQKSKKKIKANQINND